MDAAFNFDLAESIVSGIVIRDARNITRTLKRSIETYSEKRSNYYDSIFLTNHDQKSRYEPFPWQRGYGKTCLTLFTLPGVSWV